MPTLAWRIPDTRRLAGLAALLIGASATAGLLVSAAVSLWTAVVLGVILILAVQLATARGLQRALEEERSHQQALGELRSVLPLRLPLPQMTGWAATPRLGVEIVAQVLTRQPKVVMELGSGSSTLLTAYALEKAGHGGRLISIDHDAHFADQTRSALRDHGVDAYVELRKAPLIVQEIAGMRRRWYDVSAVADVQDIDLLVIDGPPEQSEVNARAAAFSVLGDKLSPGAVIIVDDAGRPSEKQAVDTFVASHPDASVRWITTAKGIAVITLGSRSSAR